MILGEIHYLELTEKQTSKCVNQCKGDRNEGAAKGAIQYGAVREGLPEVLRKRAGKP